MSSLSQICRPSERVDQSSEHAVIYECVRAQFKQNLLDLKNKHGVEVNQRVVDDCRPNAEETVVNKWIIDAQCELLRCLVAGKSYSPGDFGYPVDKDAREAQVFEGNMPSIKRSKETIMAHSPKKGANMHDTPPKPLEY